MKSIITIFIHGTTPLKYLIFKPLLIKAFFSCPEGLIKANDIERNIHVKKIAQVISESAPKQFPLETFYLFGWSGKLSFTEREKTSIELYEEIKKIVKKHKSEVEIQLITHSHGGNIALNLAKIPDPQIKIDKLILVACPVQQRTASLISSPIFKQVYSIHSHTDIFQVIDPQGLKDLREMACEGIKNISLKKIPAPNMFFSHRHFEPSDNLSQVHVYFKKRGLFHLDFLLSRFLKQIPEIINRADKTVKSAKNKNKEISLLLD